MGRSARSGAGRAPVVRAAVAAALVAVGATVLVGLGHAEEELASAAPASAPAPAAAAAPPLLAAPTRPAPAQDGTTRPADRGSDDGQASDESAEPRTEPSRERTRDASADAPERLRASAPRPEATPRRAAPAESADAGDSRPAGRSAALAAGSPGGGAVDGGPPRVEGTPCTATARACVSLHDRKAWLLDAGKVVRGPVPIRPGDAADPTPRGTFAVQWKAEEYTSREYLTQMPYSVFFAPGGIAFHEGTFDTPSAGCVKLGHEDARSFFYFLQVGDEVQVH